MASSSKPKHKAVGDTGEELAARYLREQGYRIVECNAANKYGEIDIIAKRRGVYHFVEVKTLSGRYRRERAERFHPIDHLTPAKLSALERAIWEYRRKHGLLESDCQLDAIAVWLDEDAKHADIKYYPALEGGDS